MNCNRDRYGLPGTVVLLATLPLTSCLGRETEARRPIPPGEYTALLDVRAHCIDAIEGQELALEDGLVLPNPRMCADHSEQGDAQPRQGIPAPDPSVVVLDIRNPRTVPVTLEGIEFRTDPPQATDLHDLLAFIDGQHECLTWLSNRPKGPPGTVLLTPKTLLPNEQCHVVIGLIDPSGIGSSPVTGSVVFMGQNSMELARVPISVGN